jgi:large subunit ribosomal protein L24
MRQFGRRSLPIRKGDEVRLMRGKSKGIKGVVDRIDMKKNKIYVDGIIAKKVDGSEVMKALEPSNLMITKPNMDDKKRQAILARTEERAKVLRAQKPKEKPKPKTKPKAKPEAEVKDEKKAEGRKEAEAKKEEPKPEAKKDHKAHDHKKGQAEHKKDHKAHDHKKGQAEHKKDHKTHEHKKDHDHKKDHKETEKKEHKKHKKG